MNLIRIIAIALLIWVLYRLIRLAMRRKSSEQPGGAIKLVSCAYCKTQLPENLAIRRSDQYYCCEEHIHPDEPK